MLGGKAANRALPKREGAKPGGANTGTFLTSGIAPASLGTWLPKVPHVAV